MTGARPVQVVILAGGRGTRLRPLTDHLPKPLLPFHGKPFLGHLIEMLRDQGFTRVLLLLGYRSEAIIEHFGDGRAYGVRIDYDVTAPDDLTAYRLEHAAAKLDDTFLLLYCDNYWPMRFADLWAAYRAAAAPAQVTIYGNADGYSRDGVRVSADGFVEAFDRSRTAAGLKGVEIGYALLDKATVLPLVAGRPDLLFEEAVYPPLIRARRLHAYRTEHRYYSVGSHERLPLTERFLARRPAVILDRDGVLNERPPKAEYVRKPEDFRWLPGAREALRRLHDAGLQVAVVSNQAGVGRGVMSTAELDAVTARMRADADAAGGRIDGVFYCPHAWNAGCSCRKPAPGLLFQAQRAFQLDLTRTPFVGDDERDGEAAAAAGCPFHLVCDDRPLAAVADALLYAGHGMPLTLTDACTRVLVTGHRGYLGAVMAPYLLRHGYDVVGLDVGYFDDCTLVPDPDPVPAVRKDVRDLVPADLAGFDAVIHLAALSNDPIGNLDPGWTDAINTRATVRLAELARDAGVRRFLFSSSCIMYGAASAEVVDETAPLDPKTDYARSKVEGEAALRALAAAGFSPTYLRNGTVYGLSPRMRFDTVLNDLLASAVTTGEVRVFSDGKPWRPVVHVDDVARAFQHVLEAPLDRIHNEAFNTGADHLNHQVIELARIAAAAVPGCTVEVLNQPSADQRTYKADFDKFARTFPDFAWQWTARPGVAELAAAFGRVGLTREHYTGERFVRLRWLRRLIENGALDRELRWR